MSQNIEKVNLKILAESIINTIHEILIVLDADLRVVTVSPSFYETFKVNPSETIGHLIYKIGNGQWNIPSLHELLENILFTNTTFNRYEVEHDFAGIGKRTMLLNARRILNSPDNTPYILLAIEDVTERKVAEFASSIINTIHEPLIVLDKDLKVISASPSFYETFKVRTDETLGRYIYELGDNQWDIPQLRTLLEDILPHDSKFDDFKVDHYFEGLGNRTIILNARRIPAPPEKPRIILLAMKDVTELVQMQFIKKSRDFAEDIISTIREPLLVLDVDLKIVSANRSFYQTFHLEPKVTEGFFLYELENHQWDIPELRALLSSIINNHSSFDKFEVKSNVLNIGPKIWWLNARGIVGENGETRLILLSLDDVTKRRQAEEEFNRIFKAKSTFTVMVSHELRTPLTSLKQSISLLAKGKIGVLSQEQKQFLDIAERNLDRLVDLINNVLDFQKLESGKMTYKMEINDINIAIHDLQEIMSTLIEKKGLQLIIETDKNLPLVEFDKDKIIQVLTNLVNNALKATNNGYIKIKTQLKDPFIQVSVEDTGCGIKPEDLPKLFQEYEQLERNASGGTGLGLVISQDIIIAHSGKIWVDSILGKGSTVSFVLPLPFAKDKRTPGE